MSQITSTSSRGSCGGCAPPGEFDRTMFRGDSFVFDVQVLQDDGCSPQNITGWTAWFTAKEHYAVPDATASIRLGTASPLTGIVITSPTEGKLEIVVPPQSTVNFPDTTMCLVYDVQVKDGAGRVFTVELGTLSVRPDVTRAIS
jgi:hypothetical protein